MPSDNRKRHVVSYEKMSAELAAIFAEKYPAGLSDCLQDVKKYPKPDGTSFYAVTIETEDAIYLVKIKVVTDAVEDVEKWLDSEEEAEQEEVAGATPSMEGEDNPLPDDNIAQYGGDESAEDNF